MTKNPKGYQLTFKEFSDMLLAVNSAQNLASEMREVELQRADAADNRAGKRLFRKAARYYDSKHKKLRKLFFKMRPKVEEEEDHA